MKNPQDTYSYRIVESTSPSHFEAHAGVHSEKLHNTFFIENVFKNLFDHEKVKRTLFSRAKNLSVNT